MECPACKFAIGENIVAGECPNCGYRPERDQPSGVQSDGVLRNMKDPGYGQDMGGNPLQTGILGDWQNRQKRDESFASVQSYTTDHPLREGSTPAINSEMGDTFNMTPYMPWQHTAAATFSVVPGARAGIHNGTVKLLQFLDATVNGLSARNQGQDIVMTYSPFNREGWEQIQSQPVEVQVPYDEYIPAAEEVIANSLQPSHAGEQLKTLARRMKTGEVPFPPGINPDQVQAKVAIAPLVGLGVGLGARALAPAVKPLVQRAVGKGASMLPGAWKAAKGYAAIHGGAHLLGLGQSPNGSAPQGGQVQNLRGTQQLAHSDSRDLLHVARVLLGFEHPSSLPEIGTGGDPEAVDPHEFNVGDEHTNLYDPTVNDGGGTDSYNDEVIDAFVDALPDILEFVEDDRSGLENSKIRALHEILEGEDPEYVNHSGDLPDFPFELPRAASIQSNDQLVTQAPASVPDSISPSPSPVGAGHCPNCNGILAADGSCPQCGAVAQTQPIENPGIGQMPQTGPVQQFARTANIQLGDTVNFDGRTYQVADVYNATMPDDTHRGTKLELQPLEGGEPIGAYEDEVTKITTTPTNNPLDLHDLDIRSKTAINDHQGPKNSEQFAAVAELLEEEGRGEEIVAMLREPWSYAEELSLVQNKLNKPPIDQSKPEDVVEEAPPGDTMPVQPQMQPNAQGADPAMMGMQAALRHIGADSVAPRCPKCESSTTAVVNEDGECKCHRCGNEWKEDNLIKEKSARVADMVSGDEEEWVSVIGQQAYDAWQFSDRAQYEDTPYGANDPDELASLLSRVATDREYTPEHSDLHGEQGRPVNVPAADRQKQRDVQQEQDTSRTWIAEDGEPLQTGEEYEMHSGQYSVPDIVHVEAIKPDAIEVTVVGEYSARDNALSYRHEITRQDAELEGLEFKPTGITDRPDDDNDELRKTDETNRDDDPYPNPGEVTDLSIRSTVQSTIGLEPHPTHPTPRNVPNAARDEPFSPSPNSEWMPKVEAPHLNPGASPEEEAEWKELYKDWLENEHDPAHQQYEEGRPAPKEPKQPVRAAPEDNVLAWEPGQKGRGIFINGKLHTWPVNPTPDDPQGGLMHSDYVKQFGNIEDFSPGFEIEPDGTMVELGSMSRYPADEVDPRLKRDEGNQFNFAHTQNSHEASTEEVDPDLAWLKDGSFDTSKVAGAHFTPSEQRDFIDEDGTARNSDQLNLEGTHYEVRFDAKGNGDLVDDDHLIFGI